jgi:hypothetical protein
MEGAIRNGAWFRPIDLFTNSLDGIREQINFFKPHILFCHCIFNEKGSHKRDHVFQLLSELKKSGIFIFYHAGDARKVPRYPHDISGFVSAALCNTSMLKEYSDVWKIPCHRWPYPCLYQTEIIDHPVLEYACDLAFTGMLSDTPGHVHEERSKFVKAIRDAGIDIKIFPNEQTGNTRFQTAELARSAGAILSVQMGSDIPGYIDVRPFQYIGAGGLFLHDSGTSTEEFFNPGEHFLTYSHLDLSDIFIKLRYIKEHPSDIARVRESGFRFCQEHHGTSKRVADAIRIFERGS